VYMFLGTHTPKLDEKGRLFLPAKFRDDLSEGLVVTRGQERCLYVWPAATFRSYVSELANPLANRASRSYVRMLSAGASTEVADKQGRITITPSLREYAGLRRDVVVVGAINRVEIWDAERWQAFDEAEEDAFANWEEDLPSAP
jgi:MraZ protein